MLGRLQSASNNFEQTFQIAWCLHCLHFASDDENVVKCNIHLFTSCVHFTIIVIIIKTKINTNRIVEKEKEVEEKIEGKDVCVNIYCIEPQVIEAKEKRLEITQIQIT